MKLLSPRVFLLIAVSAFLLSACSNPELVDTKGKTVSLKSGDNRWTALNIWAEWCEPCREEIPELNALDKEGKVRVIGYDFDNSQGEELHNKATRMDIDFTVVVDSPLNVLQIRPPKALPATLLISPEGKLVDTLLGPQDRLSISSRIQELQVKGN